MAVPAKAAHYIAPFHGPITGHDVFYRARYQVPMMGQPRSEGWTVVKDERFLALGFFQRLFEGVGFLPQFKDVVLHTDKGEGAVV